MATVWRVLVTAAVVLTMPNPQPVSADCQTDLGQLHPGEPAYILENALAGDLVLHVSTSSDVRIDLGNSYFLTQRNGSIVTKMNVSLDGPSNEVNCNMALERTAITADVRCVGTNVQVLVNFLVRITDDYSPWFTREEISVDESLDVGSTIVLLETLTADPDCDNRFFFSIEGSSSQYFEVQQGTNQLILRRQLDYEQQVEHRLNLTVTSLVQSSTSRKTNSTIVTVHVTDSDDMSPVFTASGFVLHVTEGKNMSDAWLRASPPVEARDGDVGINMSITYIIVGVEPGLALEMDNQTGEVRVLELLDRERVAAYKVAVKASQVDLTYKTATAFLLILVDDVNDNPPVYTSQTNVTILEDAPNGSNVMELTGTDLDQGLNAEFDFVIGSDSIQAFGVSSQSGPDRVYLVVRNNTALMGQSLAYVQVKLVERQPGSCDYLATCVANLTVYIRDVNDHAPQFVRDQFEFLASSNTTGHVVVGQVSATDRDKGDNAKIVYNLVLIPSPVECSGLQLDPVTGEISTDQQLPAGVVCSWIVTACDSPVDPSSRRCASTYLSVTVTASENVRQLNVTILENVPIGTLVTSIAVKGALTTSADFDIQNDMLYTKMPLDRERQDLYLVAVQTSQDATTDVMDIRVSVQDVNDNTPTFEYPVYVINLDSGVDINKTVLQLSASDKDKGNNSQFAFSLANGRQYFDVDSQTGQVRLINVPMIDRSEYQLLVTDFGQPPLTGMATLRVYSTVHNETATVVLPVARDDLLADREGVVEKLSSILGVAVRIYSIESLGPVPSVGSRLYISATAADGRPLSPTELTELLETHAQAIYDKFAKASEDDQRASGRLNNLEVALICVSVILLLLVLLVVVLWCRSLNNYKHSVRLFNTLNKDTAFYDNPRKPSATAVPTTTTSAQRMLARLSSGSVGHSSMTSLIATQKETTSAPPSDSSERRQITPALYFENVAMSPIASPQIGNDDGDRTPPSYLPKLDPISDSESQRPAQAQPNHNDSFTLETPPSPHTAGHDGSYHNHVSNTESGGVGRSGDDVGDSNQNEITVEDVDEDDEEVANILSNTNCHDANSSDGVDQMAGNSSPDATTTLTPVTPLPDNSLAGFSFPGTEMPDSFPGTEMPDSFPGTEMPDSFPGTEMPDSFPGTEMPDSFPGTEMPDSFPGTEMPDSFPEPEPDYAKKVRFSEEGSQADSAQDVAHNNLSSGNPLPHLEHTSRFNATSTHAGGAGDSTEELTAL